MDILLWLVIIILFVLSIAGIFLPVLPDTLLLWGGFLLYHFFVADPGSGLPASFWWGMAVLSILLYGADLLTNMYFVKRYGGSKASSWAAALGIFLGIFVFPPFGMLIMPFVLVVLVELLLQKQPLERAVKAGVGSLVGFLGSAVVKVVLQVVMIIWFFIAAF
ncbi:DUF456 domain-containing protein [Brevibacillus composti]|uniref:DUF456 domain-containing protein n=1 Tax=Brevibacillus composti TaxID=2796470 RepID=A0A7T5JQH2_9BACL|nr:DUF456 domain-containing protein [Brevibacillus composti]QQE76247.1 DUF456 domain-containing protein [Brevibacillus composti]QUO43275.1 DUF456 domain-containing protein [Brevibacillus composti]